MKKWTCVFSLFVTMVLVFAAFSSTASAQALDDTWLAIKVQAKGYVVNPSGNADKAKFKAMAYMHITWDDGNTQYDYEIYTETSGGTWEVTNSGSFAMEEKGYIFISDDDWDIDRPGPSTIHFYFTGVIMVKTSGDTLKKASFLSLGAEVDDGTLNGTNVFYGGAKLKGKDIAESKLPFTP